jgi:hypothetical protein
MPDLFWLAIAGVILVFTTVCVLFHVEGSR